VFQGFFIDVGYLLKIRVYQNGTNSTDDINRNNRGNKIPVMEILVD
jgi:hypothetical protein